MSLNSPTVSAWDFMQILNEEAEVIPTDILDTDAHVGRYVFHLAADIWDSVSKAGGWAPGATLADAYKRFQGIMQHNMDQTSDKYESAAYQKVLDYLSLV